jgi:hypothetical protein
MNKYAMLYQILKKKIGPDCARVIIYDVFCDDQKKTYSPIKYSIKMGYKSYKSLCMMCQHGCDKWGHHIYELCRYGPKNYNYRDYPKQRFYLGSRFCSEQCFEKGFLLGIDKCFKGPSHVRRIVINDHQWEDTGFTYEYKKLGSIPYVKKNWAPHKDLIRVGG